MKRIPHPVVLSLSIAAFLVAAVASSGCVGQMLPSKKQKNAQRWTMTQKSADSLGEPLARHTGSTTTAEYVRRMAQVYLWGCVDRPGQSLTAAQAAIRVSVGATLVARLQANFVVGNERGKGFEYSSRAREDLEKMARTAGQRCDLSKLDSPGHLAHARRLLAKGGPEQYISSRSTEIDGALAALEKAGDAAAVRRWEKNECRPKMGIIPCVRRASAAVYRMGDWDVLVQYYVHIAMNGLTGKDLLDTLVKQHGKPKIVAGVERYIAAHPTLDDHPHDGFAAGNMLEFLTAAGRINCSRLPMLTRMLKSKRPGTVVSGLRYLSKNRCGAAEPAVRPLVASTKWRLRRAAVMALGRIGSQRSMSLLRSVSKNDMHCSRNDRCARKAALRGVRCVCFPVRAAAKRALISVQAR